MIITPEERNGLAEKIRLATSKIGLTLREIEHVIDDIKTAVPAISVKNETVFQEIAIPWHTMLLKVFLWCCKLYPGQILVTSGRRHDGSTHDRDPIQALDLRSRLFLMPKTVEATINQNWDYGKINPKTDRPYDVCLYHRTVKCLACRHKFEVDPDIGPIASTVCPECKAPREKLTDYGPHFHLQVCDLTRRIL